MISRFSVRLAFFSALAVAAVVFVIACWKNGYMVGLQKAIFSAVGGAVFGGGMGEVLVIIFPDLQFSTLEREAERERTDYVFPDPAEEDEEKVENV